MTSLPHLNKCFKCISIKVMFSGWGAEHVMERREKEQELDRRTGRVKWIHAVCAYLKDR